jgi:transcriptional regulator with XRE-family HTH domain
MPLVDRIQILAKASNETLSGIERTLHFGNGSIRKWDVNIPSADKLQRVADYFNVTMDYLLGRTEYPNPVPPPNSFQSNAIFHDLSEDEYAALLVYLALYRELKKMIPNGQP